MLVVLNKSRNLWNHWRFCNLLFIIFNRFALEIEWFTCCEYVLLLLENYKIWFWQKKQPKRRISKTHCQLLAIGKDIVEQSRKLSFFFPRRSFVIEINRHLWVRGFFLDYLIRGSWFVAKENKQIHPANCIISPSSKTL